MRSKPQVDTNLVPRTKAWPQSEISETSSVQRREELAIGGSPECVISPIQMISKLNIQRLYKKVTFPLASFYSGPVKSLPNGRRFMTDMLCHDDTKSIYAVSTPPPNVEPHIPFSTKWKPSPIQMVSALKLCQKVTSSLASFYPRPITSPPDGHMFAIKMPSMEKALKDKSTPEVKNCNKKYFLAAVKAPGQAAGLIEKLLSLGANSVASTKPCQPCRQLDALSQTPSPPSGQSHSCQGPTFCTNNQISETESSCNPNEIVKNQPRTIAALNVQNTCGPPWQSPPLNILGVLKKFHGHEADQTLFTLLSSFWRKLGSSLKHGSLEPPTSAPSLAPSD